ncbi:hypothetical protein FOZG_17645 [Fusarium oxysporum Fo47]|uniref:Enoyl reductase (ER) domain-containing protein n=2 Tax=Fusarium oxysporum Fo47 TaxID=660027 RepID=W9JG35_FUSOX|nr:hypothetical protein FOZG_17645 [Fusarium oxysporum Fo47]
MPEPNGDQVLIKVVVSGSNPKDWKVPEYHGITTNSGDDIAGIVTKVGFNVTEFKPGDRVAALHEVFKPHGSYAEYAIAWAYTTFHIPKETTFEEAAAIPLTAMTAALSLYQRLGLPQPWQPAQEPMPLIIYGAASAVGAYAVQLAKQSNIHPLITVAGRALDYVESLIDRTKGDTIIDYRAGDDAVVEGLKKALGNNPAMYALDAVSDNGSYVNIGKVLGHGAKITFVLPGKEYPGIPENVEQTVTSVGIVHEDNLASQNFAFVYFRLFGRGLQEGWLKPQRQEIVPGGLAGIQPALDKLKAGKASGVKYVFRISDTEGIEK